MTEEEYDIAMDYLRSAFPRPEAPLPLSPQNATLWRENGLKVLADFFEEIGLGHYPKEGVILAGPADLTNALEGVLPLNEASVVTGYYTVFGSVFSVLSDGREVSVDPTTQVIYLVAPAFEPDPMNIVLQFGPDVEAALEDAKDITLKAADGSDLRNAAVTAQGGLQPFEAFGFSSPPTRGGQPEPADLYRAPLRTVLAQSGPYQIIEVAAEDNEEGAAPLGEGWADGWADDR